LQLTIQITKQKTNSNEQNEQNEEESEDVQEEKESDENNSHQEENSDKQQDNQQNTSNKKTDRNSTEKNNEELYKLYHQETNGNAIYRGNETRPFLQWLENRKKEKVEKNEEQVDKSDEKSKSKEEWENLLINWINEADDEEISKEIKKTLNRFIRTFSQLRKKGNKFMQLTQRYYNNNISDEEKNELNKITKNFEILLSKPKIIEKLFKFMRFHEQNKNWHMNEINKQKEKFPKYLAQIMQSVKREVESLRNAEKELTSKKNWKELLMVNLYQITMLSFKEKSRINSLIQKKELSQEDKKGLISILIKLKIEELIDLFGKSFEEHAENYIQWGNGWYEDPGLKRVILNDYFSSTTITRLYNKWYKDLTQRLDFNFRTARLGKSRKIISLYVFEILNNAEIDLYKIILHLEEIDISKIVLRLKEIINNANKEISRQLTSKENNLLKQLTKREIETLQDMETNYSDTFIKYFTDLVNIIKLLIISNKSHKIIGADFSLLDFVRFLMNNRDINLFMTERSFYNVVGDIFNFLKTTKYSHLFPAQVMQESSKKNHENEVIIGSRIKLFLMKYLYNGRYFDNNQDIAICPECKKEGLTINTSVPRIRAKEFHHEDDRLEGYSIKELYDLFCKSRGDPYFFPNLVEKMELESVVLRCGCHHRIIRPSYFENFKKLINWEEIPEEFPQNIFDLPADIIHMLIMVCIDNFYSLELLWKAREKVRDFDIMERKLDMKNYILINLKKKYIIDIIHGGICPICKEFNIKNHLNAFDLAHLYELSELTPEQKIERRRLRNLFKGSSCSELIREIRKQKACYICHNCHAVFHKDTSLIDQIYDDQNKIKKILIDKVKVIKKFKQNIIYNTDLIKDPLKTEKTRYDSFMEYLIALYEISKTIDDGVTRKDIKNYLKHTSQWTIFETRDYSDKYVRIISGTKQRATRYYITDEGKKIVRLIYYFRDYYKNIMM